MDELKHTGPPRNALKHRDTKLKVIWFEIRTFTTTEIRYKWAETGASFLTKLCELAGGNGIQQQKS